MWKEAVVAYSETLSRNSLEGLRKITKNISEDSRDMNLGPSEYEYHHPTVTFENFYVFVLY
jgi:hypothetical protein